MFIRKVLILSCLLILSSTTYAQLIERAAVPISDTIYSIDKSHVAIALAGREGVFYSLDEGDTFESFSNFVTIEDSISLYNSIIVDIMQVSNITYMCGKDTTTNLGVIFLSENFENTRLIYSDQNHSKFHNIARVGSNIFFLSDYRRVLVNTNSPSTIVNDVVIDFNATSPYKFGSMVSLPNSTTTTFAAISDDHLSHQTQQTPVGFIHRNWNVGFEQISRQTSNHVMAFKGNELYVGTILTNSPILSTNISDKDTFTFLRYWFTDNNAIGSKNGLYFKFHNRPNFEKVIGTEGLHVTGISSVYQNSFLFSTIDGRVFEVLLPDIETNPLARFTYEPIYCSDNFYTFSAHQDDDYIYEWFIGEDFLSDDAEIEINLSDYSSTLLTLVTHKNEYSDTFTVNLTLNAPLNESINYSFSQHTICHEGTVDISVETEQGIMYALYNSGNALADTIFMGTGNEQIITTKSFSDTSSFYLLAGYPQNVCSIIHELDTVFVQHPRADFHSGLINADVGEEVTLFDISENSDTLEWFLTPTVPLFSEENAYYMTYEEEGFKTIGVVAKTNFGCVDTLIREKALFVVDTLSYVDKCFGIHIYQTKRFTTFLSSGSKLMNDMITDSEGNFYVSGSSRFMVLESEYGMGTDTLTNHGFFLAKYNKFGALKWMVELAAEYDFDHPLSHPQNRSTINGIRQLSNGDFVLNTFAHQVSLAGVKYFFDNTGKKIPRRPSSFNSAPVINTSEIIRIDKNGKYISSLRSRNNEIVGDCDEEGNFYTLNKGYQLYYIGRDTAKIIETGPSFQHFVSKISHDGNLIWNIPVGLNFMYDLPRHEHSMLVSEDMVYFRARQFDGVLNSKDGSMNYSPVEIPNLGSSGVIAAYDTSGVHQWHYRYSFNQSENTFMEVDDASNLYVIRDGGSSQFQLSDKDNEEYSFNGGLVVFKKSGEIKYHYDLNFPFESVMDFEIKGNRMQMIRNNFGAYSSFPPKVIEFDLDANIINEQFYGEGGIEAIHPNRNHLPYEVTFNNNNNNNNNTQNIYMREMSGIIQIENYWDFNYYPFNFQPNGGLDGRSFLISNTLESHCTDTNIIVIGDSIICKEDTLTISLEANFPSQHFLSNNIFTIQLSETPYFLNGDIGDSISFGNNLEDLSHAINLTETEIDTLWYRIKSSNPPLNSSLNYTLLHYSSQVDLFDSLLACPNSEFTVSTHSDLETYDWFNAEDSIFISSGSHEITKDIHENPIEIYVKLSNSCNNSWSHSYFIDILENDIFQEEYEFIKCKNEEITIYLDSTIENTAYQFDYFHDSLTPYSYVFNMTEDSTVYFTISHPNGCNYLDSLSIIHYPDIPIIFTITEDDEIHANQSYITYNWSSESEFIEDVVFSHIIKPQESGTFTLLAQDIYECFHEDSIQFSMANLKGLNSSLNIYPNPAKDMILVSTDNINNFSLSILDFNGKVIQQISNISETTEIDIEQLDSGSYLIKIDDGKQLLFKRFVKI